MRFVLAIIVSTVPAIGAADAANPWPAVFEMMEANNCTASEDEIIAVMTDQGVDSWTQNVMIANAGEAGTFSYDRDTGIYSLHKTEKCN
jgi:hypothetical protein